ncbi:hypothetical protein HDV05_000557 [Chytridiales sp. JEL 0842]|nr:hypothetical protein HDV05_000557 [Chytridiales sp. JEL 0842]
MTQPGVPDPLALSKPPPIPPRPELSAHNAMTNGGGPHPHADPPTSTTSVPVLDLAIPPRRWTVSKFMHGVQLSFDGSIRALRSPQVRKPFLFSLGFLVAVLLMVFAVGHGLTLPLRIVRGTLKRVVGTRALGLLDLVIRISDQVIYWFITMTPDAALYFLRYVYPQPLDKLFFASMKQITTEVALPGSTARFTLRFARSLESAPGGRVSYFVRLMAYGRRYSRRLGIVFMVWVASYVPIFGRMAWPAATFFYTGIQLGWTPALWISGFGLISPPWRRYVAGPLLRSFLAFRSLGRELVEPYLCRSKMDTFARRAWFYRHEPIISGFVAPCFLMLMIPVVGPVYFCVAQAAVARLCIDYFDETDLFEGGPRERTYAQSVVGSPKRGKEINSKDPMVVGEGSSVQQVAVQIDRALDWCFAKWDEHWRLVRDHSRKDAENKTS